MRDGYVVIEKLFDDAEVAALRSAATWLEELAARSCTRIRGCASI
jgi:hypothetical protein